MNAGVETIVVGSVKKFYDQDGRLSQSVELIPKSNNIPSIKLTNPNLASFFELGVEYNITLGEKPDRWLVIGSTRKYWETDTILFQSKNKQEAVEYYNECISDPKLNLRHAIIYIAEQYDRNGFHLCQAFRIEDYEI